jgi:hypothetical protein
MKDEKSNNSNSNNEMDAPSFEAAKSRAPSTPSSAKARLLPQQSLTALTRKWSVSPLTSRTNRAGVRSATSVTRLGSVRKMSSPGTPSTPTPSTPDTVRKRRGFRPLSIVTSALFPFDFDPVETMEKAEGQAVMPTPSKALEEITRQAQPAQLQSSPVVSDTSSSTTPSPSKAASVETQIDTSEVSASTGAEPVRLSSISTIAEKKSTPAPSIKTQLESLSVDEYLRRMKLVPGQSIKEAAPDPDVNVDKVVIEDEYPKFYDLPPPDPKAHPFFKTDPFNCTDINPPLTTNWTKYQIKQFCAEKYLRDRNMIPDDDGKSSIRSKINPFNQKSPEKEQTTIFQALDEGSAEPASAKKPKLLQTPRRDMSRNATPTELRLGSAVSTTTTTTDDFDKKTGGLRSLSNLFKGRSSSETKSTNASTLTISSPIDHSIMHPTATPELKRYDLVRVLAFFQVLC